MSKESVDLSASRRERGFVVSLTIMLFLALLASTGARPSAAITTPTAVLTIAAAADTYVQASSPNATAGSSGTLYVDNSPVQHALLRFNVSGLNGQQVASAKLRLYATDPSPKGGDFHLTATSAWAEATTNWKNAPAANAAVITSLPSVANGRWYEADLSSVVTGDGVVSLRVTSTSSDGARFASREATGGHAPQLVVTYSIAATPTATPTATPAAADPVVMAAGDIACDPANPAFNGGAGTATSCLQLATSNLLLAEHVDAVLPLGDNQYENGILATYLASYATSWGRVLDVTHPVPGNHEYQTSGASGYFDYFGGAAGGRTTGYYSYDLGTWHLIALNSNCAPIGGCGPESPQEEWLRADLAAHPVDCVLAYWHHPRFSSGEHGSDQMMVTFWQDLYAAGADVVLSGHDHDYERFAPQDAFGTADPLHGIREFVVGTGGKSHYAIVTPQPNSEVRDSATAGVLKLTLRPGSYAWQFLPAVGGSFTDQGSQGCGTGAGIGTTAPTAPSGLTATAVAPGQVDLVWTAASGATSYLVKRSPRVGGPYTSVGSPTPAGGTTYTDSGLVNGTTYYYVVTAVNDVGEGGPSNEAWATPVPAPTASSLTFSATDDTYIQASAPDATAGTDTTIQVDNSPVKHILLRFNVTGLAGRQVTGAKLRLYGADPSPKGGDFYRTASNAWSEATATWNNAPVTSGPLIASLGSVAINTWYEVDLSSIISGDGIVSLRVTSTNSNGADYTSNNGVAGFRPQLVVSYSVSAPTLPLPLTGLMGTTTGEYWTGVLGWTAARRAIP